MTDRAIQTQRPTIQVRGRENERVTALLLSMRMTETEGGMSSLELRLTDVASERDGRADYAFDDEQILALGTALTVSCGEEDAPQEIFKGAITALELSVDEENPPELVVYAEDALQKARFARRTKVWDDASIADVVNEVAQAASLTPQVRGLDSRLGTLVQLDETDLAFLRRLLSEHGGDLQVVGDELQVSTRDGVQRGSVRLERGNELVDLRVVADLAEQVTQVTVTGWDATQGARVTGRSSASVGGPGSGRQGPAELEQSFGRRIEHLGQLCAVENDGEARALAEAAFAHRSRRFVRAWGTAVGNPALRVGTHVTLAGVPGRWQNTYYVVRAEHSYDQMVGYRTGFEAECAFLGNA
jgi:uncharacterized protein